MSDELRVQRREACEHAPLDCDDFELPWRCDGCNGDGTRWVTVGTLDPCYEWIVSPTSGGRYVRVLRKLVVGTHRTVSEESRAYMRSTDAPYVRPVVLDDPLFTREPDTEEYQ